MPPVPGYLVDTNVLLRISRQHDKDHQIISSALLTLEVERSQLYYSLQNVAEFWNVCTRPLDRNGFGMTIAETNRSVKAIEDRMTYLPDDQRPHHMAPARDLSQR